MSTPKKLVQYTVTAGGSGESISPGLSISTTTLVMQANAEIMVGDEAGQELAIAVNNVFTSSGEEINLRDIYVRAASGTVISVTYYEDLI